jgi:hypothetical protein
MSPINEKATNSSIYYTAIFSGLQKKSIVQKNGFRHKPLLSPVFFVGFTNSLWVRAAFKPWREGPSIDEMYNQTGL